MKPNNAFSQVGIEDTQVGGLALEIEFDSLLRCPSPTPLCAKKRIRHVLGSLR